MKRLEIGLKKGELTPLAKVQQLPSYVSIREMYEDDYEDDPEEIISGCNKQMVYWLNDFFIRNPDSIVYATGALNGHEDIELLGKVILSFGDRILIEDNPIRAMQGSVYARLGHMEQYDVYDKSIQLNQGMPHCLWLGADLEYIEGFYFYTPKVNNIYKAAMLDKIN